MYQSSLDLTGALTLDVCVIAGTWLLGRWLDRSLAVDRAIFGGCVCLVMLNYIAWRYLNTLPPLEAGFRSLWPWLFFGAELIPVTFVLISTTIMLRWSDHSADADRGEAWLRAQQSPPAVDVFIATYNESLSVLEKTILAAKVIDYPDFTVWVLDDKRRDWLRDFCAAEGVEYVTRPDNAHAKAGNLNHGISWSAARTNAPYLLALDADFAPQADILMRTVGLFADRRVGLVQTPQFYYNPDPIQHNLLAQDNWVDEQRVFFDVLEPARDAWGSAFCVGTSFVVRRDVLAEIGGIPQETVCEDLYTSCRLQAHGYVTRWLNERLSVGLAAEGLGEYITQRTRWCLGTLQLAFMSDSPLVGRGYTFPQRLHFFHGLLHWLSQPFALLMLIAPVLYTLFGTPAILADHTEFMRYGVPALALFWGYSRWISNSRTLPVFTEVTQIVSAVAVSLTIIGTLLRPFGEPFKVTAKGGDRSAVSVHWPLATVFASIVAVLTFSLFWPALSGTVPAVADPGATLNRFWTVVSMVLAFVALLVCVELPRPRAEERFAVDEPGVYDAGSGSAACRIVDLSVSGASIRPGAVEGTLLPLGQRLMLSVANVGDLPAYVVRHTDDRIGVAFDAAPMLRRRMIQRLFSRSPSNVAETAAPGAAFLGLFRRAFGTVRA